MPTQFNENFNNGDLIEAGHIKQVFQPINDLEQAVDQLGSHTHSADDITSGVLPVTQGGTSLSAIPSNRLLGSGYSANTIQPISIGYGLSLINGYLSNTLTSTLNGNGSTNKLAYWSSSNNLTYSGSFSINGYELQVPYLRLTSNLIYTNGSKLYVQRLGNNGGGALCYYDTTSHEVFYQFSTSSHKEDIKPVNTSIEELMDWKPVQFKWKQAFGGTDDIGLIAEDVAEVSPRSALYDKPWKYKNMETGEYEVNEDGSPAKEMDQPEAPVGVKYEKAWIPMLAAVQDFYQKYKLLEAEVQELKAELRGQR